MYRTITRILGVGVFAISSVCTHAFGSVTGCVKYDKGSNHRWYPSSPVMGSFGSPVYSSDDYRKTQLTNYGEYLIPYNVLPENIGSCTGTGMVYDYDDTDPCKWSRYCSVYTSWRNAYTADGFKYGVAYRVGDVDLGWCTPNGVQITSGDLMDAYFVGCTSGIAPSGCWYMHFNNCGFDGMVRGGYHCCIVDAHCNFGYYMTGRAVPSGVLLEPYDDFCQSCPAAGNFDWVVTSNSELVGITSCRMRYVGSGFRDNTGTYTYDGLCNYVQ